MAKIILFNMITLDGFFEGKDGNIDWHNVDAEFNDFAIDQLDSAEALIFGRITYDLMAAYWPSRGALKDDPHVAERMNRIPKYVFSRTISDASWQNTTVINRSIEKEVKKLKAQSEKNLFIFGSANLVSTFRKLDLIDEYRIIVNPVILGGGTPLFKKKDGTLDLKLIQTKVFNSGNILLYYEPL